MAVKKKIAILGDSAVGKTSLIRRYVFDRFDDTYITTIGSKVTKKDIRIRTRGRVKDLKLMIWDILGREGYAAVHARTFAGVHGAIVVADLTRRETLETLERYWVPLLFKVVDSVPIVFAANKSDLADKYAFELDDVQRIASRHNADLEASLPDGLTTSYATSAKTGDHVEMAFESLGHLMLSESRPDPIKELYESLVALGVQRESDKTTPIGALDSIIVNFCEGFDDDRVAMSILRQEIVRAGIDIRSPSTAGLFMLVEYLAEAESEFQDFKEVEAGRKKRQKLVSGVKD